MIVAHLYHTTVQHDLTSWQFFAYIPNDKLAITFTETKARLLLSSHSETPGGPNGNLQVRGTKPISEASFTLNTQLVPVRT